MDIVDKWLKETVSFANKLVEIAQQMQEVDLQDVGLLVEVSQELVDSIVRSLSLLPQCEALAIIEQINPAVSNISPQQGQEFKPLLDIGNQLSLLTASSGAGQIIWAQERTGLPGILENVPLPEKERRVVDNLLWTRDMFESSTKALEGVSEEMERQDGSGARKAKAAAREIENKAKNPPVKPNVFVRVARAVGNFFRSLFN